MQIYDWLGLDQALKEEHYQFKAIFNEKGIIFFPANGLHREQKAQGISYEDGSAGNALAVVISPGRIEIRHHPRFTAERVRGIVHELLRDEKLERLRGFVVTYQGKVINPPSVSATLIRLPKIPAWPLPLPLANYGSLSGRRQPRPMKLTHSKRSWMQRKLPRSWALILVTSTARQGPKRFPPSNWVKEYWRGQTSTTQQCCEAEHVSGIDSPTSRDLSKRS